MVYTKYMKHGQSLSRIFTPAFARKLLNNQTNSYFKELSTTFPTLRSSYKNNDYKQFYRKSFDLMCEGYRNEYIYKTYYYTKALKKKEKSNRTKVASELRIGSSIADLVSIETDGITIEIKSDIDRIEKSVDQLFNYQQMFPYTSLISCRQKIEKISKHVPEQSGLYVLKNDLDIECLQEAKYYDKRIDYKTMFYTLRRNEYENIIEKHYGRIPNVPNGDIFNSCFKYGESIPKDIFIGLFNTEIKNRVLKIDNPTFKIPDYMIFLAKKSSLRKTEKDQLINKLSE